MSFDQLAPHYRWMETVLAGPLLHRCRTRFVSELGAARQVLVLGPGRSRFTQALLQSAPGAHVTLVDSSRAMLERLERDLEASGVSTGRVTFVHGDVRTWSAPPVSFDAVTTHFFLDCFEPAELDVVVERVAHWTAPGARWLLSDFQVPAHGWRRQRARVVHALMYTFFRTTTGISARSVTPPGPSLHRAGFRLVSRDISNHGLLHADLWVRASHVKPAGNRQPQMAAGYRT